MISFKTLKLTLNYIPKQLYTDSIDLLLSWSDPVNGKGDVNDLFLKREYNI